MTLDQFIARRLFVSVFLLLGVSVIVFGVIRLAPGDPVMVVAGLDALPETVEAIRKEWGFDLPVYMQYFRWLGRAVRLDFGQSLMTREKVSEMIVARLPATIKLNLVAYALALAVSIPMGIYAALRQYSLLDHLGTVVALVGVSMPGFWLGLILILYFALYLGWFPVFGIGTWKHYVLPSVALGASQAAGLMRMTRSSVLESMNQDYIRTARAKGLAERVVVFKHMLKNASLPIVTIMGMRLAYLLSGSFIIETIFAWPGIGRLAINCLYSRDYFVVQGTVLLTAVVIVFANLIVDVTYCFLDPRIRYQ
ncbi:MAG: ABC transporter permease [Bacillota bacterium]|nr:ABC transporter permease [Bacillota bacterium]